MSLDISCIEPQREDAWPLQANLGLPVSIMQFFHAATTSIMGGHASHKIVDQFIHSRYTKFGSVSSTRTKFALGTMVSRRIG